MTKKDYELIAYCIFTANISFVNALGDFEGKTEKAVRYKVAYWFAENLRKENPRFNLDKFMRACGVSVEPSN